METSTYKLAKNPDATKTFGFWRGFDIPGARRRRKVLFVDAESTGIGSKNRKKTFSSRKHEILYIQTSNRNVRIFYLIILFIECVVRLNLIKLFR